MRNTQFPPRTVAVHVGIAWHYRATRTTENAKTHAVVKTEGVYPVRTWEGRVSWSEPWLKLCDGMPADERRTGWAEDLDCPQCRKMLSQ